MKLNAEWMPYMNAYRLYDPKNPRQTVVYENDEDAAERHAVENGYDGIVICDAGTMHAECCWEE